MKKILTFLLLSTLALSCAKNSESPKAVADTTDHFKDMKGCFLLYNMKTKTFDKVIGEANCRERLPPFSSFKIPLAVMAFDSGFLKDENQILKWDGVKDARPEVNQDHNAKTFIRDSVVWFSKRITTNLGKKKFQKYLNDFNYGNKDISTGITEAWLVSPGSTKGLRISPYEQVEFMKSLWTDQLPVSKRSMQLTREITYIETSPKGYKLSGKTGSNFYDKERKFHCGWFISHVQKGDQEYIAVTNLSDLKPFPGQGYGGWRARQITKDLLATEGLW